MGVIGFRPLAEADLPTLHRWLNDPGVIEWWEGDDVSLAGVVRDYWTDVRAEIEHWLVLDDGAPFGWIQCYPVTADPDECGPWLEFGVTEDAAGIDYLVGESASRGKGRGAAMIDRFVVDVVFGLHPGWTQACAAPFSSNEASWRALAKADFRHMATIDDPDGPCHLMVRTRSAQGASRSDAEEEPGVVDPIRAAVWPVAANSPRTSDVAAGSTPNTSPPDV